MRNSVMFGLLYNGGNGSHFVVGEMNRHTRYKLLSYSIILNYSSRVTFC